MGRSPTADTQMRMLLLLLVCLACSTSLWVTGTRLLHFTASAEFNVSVISTVCHNCQPHNFANSVSLVNDNFKSYFEYTLPKILPPTEHSCWTETTANQNTSGHRPVESDRNKWSSDIVGCLPLPHPLPSVSHRLPCLPHGTCRCLILPYISPISSRSRPYLFAISSYIFPISSLHLP